MKMEFFVFNCFILSNMLSIIVFDIYTTLERTQLKSFKAISFKKIRQYYIHMRICLYTSVLDLIKPHPHTLRVRLIDNTRIYILGAIKGMYELSQ